MSEVLPGARRRPAASAQERAPAVHRAGGRPPATLLAAAAIVAGEVSVELSHVLGRGELTGVAKVSLGILIGSQLLLAWGAMRRRAGPVLGLFAAQIATALAAGANAELGAAVRVGLGAATVAVVALLAVSLRTFPSPTLTPRP